MTHLLNTLKILFAKQLLSTESIPYFDAMIGSTRYLRHPFKKGFFLKYPFQSSIRILSLTSLVTLMGCGSMSQITPGTPLQTVISQYGQPSISCPNPDGGQRVVWSTEPSGQYAWRADVSASGAVSAFTQVLTNNEFQVLNQGTWSAERVRCHFGAPNRIETYPDKPDQAVWQYPYIGDANAGYMLLYASVDKVTNNVVGYSTAPNPELNTMFFGR